MSNVNKSFLVLKVHLPHLFLFVCLSVCLYFFVWIHIVVPLCAYDHALGSYTYVCIPVCIPDWFPCLNCSSKTNPVPPTLWQEGIRNKPSTAFVVRKTDLSGKLMLIDTLSHASIFLESQSPLTDDGRTGRLGVVRVHRGYLRRLERKMRAHTALTVQSLSPAHYPQQNFSTDSVSEVPPINKLVPTMGHEVTQHDRGY